MGLTWLHINLGSVPLVVTLARIRCESEKKNEHANPKSYTDWDGNYGSEGSKKLMKISLSKTVKKIT